VCFFFQAEDGIRDFHVTGVQTCALPILYQLIWERTISSQLAKAEYKAVTLELLSEDGKYKFHAKSRELIKKGWMVFGKDCLNEEIGRASCRERVEVAVLAASFYQTDVPA